MNEKPEFKWEWLDSDEKASNAMEKLAADETVVVVGGNADLIDNGKLSRFLDKGSRKDRRCMKCNGRVYLSPRSEAVVAGMAEPQVMCVRCVVAMVREDKDGN